MTKDEIVKLVADAAGLPIASIVQKERAGRQIKANALYEGSSSPANPRTPVGVFFATDSPDLAVQGAKRRLSLDLPYPEAVVILDVPNKSARVFGYADSELAAQVATLLGSKFEPVSRPAFAKEAKPAGSLGSSQLEAALKSCPNVILQGPPGTGKSSIALELVRTHASKADGLTSDQCRFGAILAEYPSVDAMIDDADGLALKAPIVWEMVQLHAGYGYEDLVRRTAPVASDGQLKFEVQDRLLPKLCDLAAKRGLDQPVLLILDEINRCNLAATLGECVFAIDPGHRGVPVRLQYQQAGLRPDLRVPSNLWIVGTMNTADRTIAMVDYAIRRRFRFIDVPAVSEAIRAWYAGNPKQADVASELFLAVNDELKPAVMVSHSAFMIAPLPLESWPSRMARQIAFHVAPLLLEYAREGLRPSRPLHWSGQDFELTDPTELTVKLQAVLINRTAAA